jgi:hypothetical protein
MLGQETENFSINDVNFYLRIFSSLGALVAIYSYYVKVKYFQNPKTYRALCDINEHMSCTRVLSSR